MRTLHAFLVLVCLGLGSAEGAVTLSWDPNIEPDLGGYLLSYGTSSGQYIGTIDVGNVTSFQFVEPNPTVRYYLALRAYDTAGANSPFSNEVVTTPAAAALTLNGLSSNRTSPQAAGTTIAFSTGGTGGTPPYRYKWFIVNGSTTTVAQNWSTSNTFTWIPTVAGTGYRIRVWARNASSTADAPANPGAVLEMACTHYRNNESGPIGERGRRQDGDAAERHDAHGHRVRRRQAGTSRQAHLELDKAQRPRHG